MTTATALARTPGTGERYMAAHDDGPTANEILSALAEDRLELDWQCIVPADGGAPVSHEVLVRLRRLDGTRLLPARFLGVAEAAGHMAAIDRHVLERTIRWLGTDGDRLPVASSLSVNVSAAGLTAPDFVPWLMRTLALHGVAGNRLCLEVTETMAIKDLHAAARRLDVLRAAGLTVALDDFGTGYSSLGHLSLLPADMLKIDGMFVLGMLERNVDAAIVRGIIELGHSLRMDVVAEYVEDDARLDVLRDMGVDRVQGYAFGRPVPLGTLA